MAQTIAPNLVGFDAIPQTIPHFCIESFRRNSKPDALAFKLDEMWHRITGTEAIARIRNIALGLSALGVKAGDKLAIISENRPEWSFIELMPCSPARACATDRASRPR